MPALETSAFKETALLAFKGAAHEIVDRLWFGHRRVRVYCVVLLQREKETCNNTRKNREVGR
jgi:hypothetical protein